MNTSFTSLGILPNLVQNLKEASIDTPTPIQSEAIPVILQKSDVIAIAQTGSGKTFAYLLPILTMLEQNPNSRALVLSPTRETAEQIHRVLKEVSKQISISVGLAITGVPVATQVKELKKNPRLIVATPGRMNEHLQGNKLLLKGLDLLVLDEADRMLDLGFEAQLKYIQSTLRGDRQTILFAATFGAWAEPVAQLFMKPNPVMIRSQAVGAPVATLSQKVYFLSASQKERRLLDELRKIKEGTIVFCESQESSVAVGRLLAHHDFSSEFVHGDMNPGHRNRVLREFREQKFQILVTTDILARGLDVPSVKYVISYDLPYRGEEFLHRIGRTARAGREGTAITFVTPSDGRTYRRLKQYLDGADEETLSANFIFVDR